MALTERHEGALALLRRLMPPPAPMSGWGYQRQQIEAHALGVVADDAASDAIMQMGLSAVAKWNGEAVTISNVPGAGGEWLGDWGRKLGTPRAENESDQRYSRRILSEVVRPASNNVGMGLVLDEALGIDGTRVVDACGWANVMRLNSGLRLNGRDRVWGFGPGVSLNATFAVILSSPDYAYLQRPDIEKIIQRRRVAGTRLLTLAITGLKPVTSPAPRAPLSHPFRLCAFDARLNQGRAIESLSQIRPNRRVDQRRLRINGSWRLEPIGGIPVFPVADSALPETAPMSISLQEVDAVTFPGLVFNEPDREGMEVLQ